MVRSRRFELPQSYPYSDLNAARLPFRHDRKIYLNYITKYIRMLLFSNY